MLTQVKITDNKNTPLRYVADVFPNGKTFDFKPGINIIVGENGCGKSTLLKLIAIYGLCENTMVSRMPSMDNLLFLGNLFQSSSFHAEKNTMYDGCDVKMCYEGVSFRLMESGGTDNLDAFSMLAAKHCRSTGEGILAATKLLFQKMNTESEVTFPIDTIKEYIGKVNDIWSNYLTLLLNYYRRNHVNATPETFEYTVLMDEPDRNLDIKHIKELYKVLSYHRPMTQLVAVIHNPVLIYKLMQHDEINFVELTPNYLDSIIGMVRWMNL